MLLFFIRHGETGNFRNNSPTALTNEETVDNVAGKYAGVTDSALTAHGVLQANRLAQHLAETTKVSHIFSSDLQRAFKTAEAIRSAQKNPPVETVKVTALREKDFGSYEGVSFIARPPGSSKSGKAVHREKNYKNPGFKDEESKESMVSRTNAFVNDCLAPLFGLGDEESVVVVAHGIILNHLWNNILRWFLPSNVSIMPGLLAADQSQSLEYLAGWSNTGYLLIEIRDNTAPSIQSESPSKDTILDIATNGKGVVEEGAILNEKGAAANLHGKTLVVKAINSLEHLKGLKKSKGGLGNIKYDEGQKTIESFFKKRKLE